MSERDRVKLRGAMPIAPARVLPAAVSLLCGRVGACEGSMWGKQARVRPSVATRAGGSRVRALLGYLSAGEEVGRRLVLTSRCDGAWCVRPHAPCHAGAPARTRLWERRVRLGNVVRARMSTRRVGFCVLV